MLPVRIDLKSAAVALAFAVGVLALIAALAAGAPPHVASAATTGVVATNTLTTNVFVPAIVNINAGDTVEWTFAGDNLHDVLSEAPEAFSSGYLPPNLGYTYSHTYNTPGSFPYVCSVHAEMTGTVNVAGATPTPTASATPTATPQAAGDWTATGDFATQRMSMPIARLADGSVLAIGGFDIVDDITSVERYLPASNSWIPGVDTGIPRANHSATTLLTGEVLIAGGEGVPNTTLLSSAQRFSPALQSWSSTGEMGVVRRNHVATLLADGRVLVTGGQTKTGPSLPYLASGEIYDRGSDGWSSAGAMTVGRAAHTATRLPDGRVLVAGGTDGVSALAGADIYNPVTNAWTSAQAMITGRIHAAAAVLPDGRVLVSGGDDVFGNTVYASAEIYDPATDTWSPAPAMHHPRTAHTATLLTDGRVLVAGGGDAFVAGDYAPAPSAEIYDAGTNQWYTASPMNAARVTAGAVRLLDGRVLVVAGDNLNPQVVDAEYYTPVAPDDGDGVPAASDNCPTIANVDQTNTDAAPIATTGAPSDISRPNSDIAGDACDYDDDNDGLPDDFETALGPAHAHHGACPSASADTDPLKLDADGDLVADRAECLLGSDPSSAASTPAPALDTDGDGLPNVHELALGSNPNAPDSDADRVGDGVEVRAYATSPVSLDTDGDGCLDGQEIASVDGNYAVNSIDLQLVAQRFGRADQPVHDVNKSGAINSLDLQLIARSFGPATC